MPDLRRPRYTFKGPPSADNPTIQREVTAIVGGQEQPPVVVGRDAPYADLAPVPSGSIVQVRHRDLDGLGRGSEAEVLTPQPPPKPDPGILTFLPVDGPPPPPPTDPPADPPVHPPVDPPVHLPADDGPSGVHLTPGWATFGQVLPQGFARGGLQVGDLPTQTDVKVTWPDGSIRHAIISAEVKEEGDYPITEGKAPKGPTVNPKVPDALVRFKVDGVTYTASLREAEKTWHPLDDNWLDGPLVVERRYRDVVAKTTDGKPHPLLRVIFDVRTYRDGAQRLDVTVENVLNLEIAGPLTYDVDVLSGGTSLFHREGVSHVWLTRWRKDFALGGLTEAVVRLDFRPFEQAGAIPHYLPEIVPLNYSVSGPEFDILKYGGVYPYMGSPGGRPDIAPYPDWTARYLVQQKSDARALTLANADLAGSWGFHIREPEGQTLADGAPAGLGPDRLISIQQRPGWWFDGRGAAGQIPLGDMTGAGKIYPDHVPSFSYVPYLVTGDRYYADEMRFMANFHLLSNWGTVGQPRGSSGLVVTNFAGRDAAWRLRDLVDAAAYLPENDPAKAYLAAAVRTNLDWLDRHAKNQQGPLGVAWLPGGTSIYWAADGKSGKLIAANWMMNYLAWSIDHANRQGFAGGTLLRDQVVTYQLRLLTSPDYPREYAGGVPAIADVTQDEATQGLNFRYYTTLKEVFEKSTEPDAQGHHPGPTPFNGYYGTDTYLMLQIADTLGLPGAREALDWLVYSPDPSIGIKGYLAARPGWNMQLSPYVPRPTPRPASFVDGAIVDEGGRGAFATVGDWVSWPEGYGRDELYAVAGDGAATATWTFKVTPGQTYNIATNWIPAGNRATNAPITIRCGTSVLKTLVLNQQRTPGDWFDAGAWWEDLARVVATEETLTVTLTNAADGYVIADAMRVDRVAGEKP